MPERPTSIQMTTRGTPPENLDMAAMRELANYQTHLAITRYKAAFRRRRASSVCWSRSSPAAPPRR